MDDKIAIFGDVHGRNDMLKVLINKIRSNYGDINMYSCGDLIDRGADSKGVIDTCIEHNINGIVGNHDYWLRELCVNLEYDPFAMQDVMGGVATAVSYGAYMAANKSNTHSDVAIEIYNSVPAKHKEWLKKLPYYRILTLSSGEKYILTHAGITFDAANCFSDEKNDEDIMLQFLKFKTSIDLMIWARPSFPFRAKDATVLLPESILIDNLHAFRDNAIQVFGHSVRPEPIIANHYIALDTGCGTKKYNQELSAVILPEKIIFKVTEYDLE